MKANEIKVGNKLLQTKSFDENFMHEIITWDESNWFRIGECIEFLEWFEPIQLTEEWLLRFGFIKVGENYENNWLLIHTHLKTKELHFILNIPNSYKYNVTVLKYVNQLQNLYFALTGEELELKQ